MSGVNTVAQLENAARIRAARLAVFNGAEKAAGAVVDGAEKAAGVSKKGLKEALGNINMGSLGVHAAAGAGLGLVGTMGYNAATDKDKSLMGGALMGAAGGAAFKGFNHARGNGWGDEIGEAAAKGGGDGSKKVGSWVQTATDVGVGVGVLGGLAGVGIYAGMRDAPSSSGLTTGTSPADLVGNASSATDAAGGLDGGDAAMIGAGALGVGALGLLGTKGGRGFLGKSKTLANAGNAIKNKLENAGQANWQAGQMGRVAAKELTAGALIGAGRGIGAATQGVADGIGAVSRGVTTGMRSASEAIGNTVDGFGSTAIRRAEERRVAQEAAAEKKRLGQVALSFLDGHPNLQDTTKNVLEKTYQDSLSPLGRLGRKASNAMDSVANTGTSAGGSAGLRRNARAELADSRRQQQTAVDSRRQQQQIGNKLANEIDQMALRPLRQSPQNSLQGDNNSFTVSRYLMKEALENSWSRSK